MAIAVKQNRTVFCRTSKGHLNNSDLIKQGFKPYSDPENDTTAQKSYLSLDCATPVVFLVLHI